MRTVILDGSALLHSTLHGVFDTKDYIKSENGLTLDLHDLRRGYLGNMLNYVNTKINRVQYKDNIIVALDKAPYWRKSIFPGYKCTRKKSRDESDKDWKDLYTKIDTCVEEYSAAVPWKFIGIPTLEADDVIGILAPRLATLGDVLIVSADHDLIQLQRYGQNIKQYSPITKKLVKPAVSPVHDLMDKVIRGDSGDAIPNIYSPDDFFIKKMEGLVSKQKSITQTLIESAKEHRYNPYKFLEEEKAINGFIRNIKLVDLSKIPDDLVKECINAYESYSMPSFFDLRRYLTSNRMDMLMNRVEDFK